MCNTGFSKAGKKAAHYKADADKLSVAYAIEQRTVSLLRHNVPY